MKKIRLDLLNNSSETEDNLRFSKENKHGKYCLIFNYWFIGFVEGDGCFNIYTNLKTKKINFTFKISQKLNNAQVLYFISKNLGCGSVRLNYKLDTVSFLVRDKLSLITKIIPIFNNNFMFSSKEHSFYIFKKAMDIWIDSGLTQLEKIYAIQDLKKMPLDSSFIASGWQRMNYMIPKSWIIGFIEAEGSFYIVEKEKNRLVHGFGLTQKVDKIILDYMSVLFLHQGFVRYNQYNFFSLDIYGSNSLKLLKKYFFNTMKSRKSLEFRIWARSFKYKGNFKKLLKIQQLLRKIRTKV